MSILSMLQTNPAIMQQITEVLKANPQLTLQILQGAAPGLFNDLEMLRSTIHQQTTQEQQIFMSKNMNSLADFMKSQEGKECLQVFIDGWASHVAPKTAS